MYNLVIIQYYYYCVPFIVLYRRPGAGVLDTSCAPARVGGKIKVENDRNAVVVVGDVTARNNVVSAFLRTSAGKTDNRTQPFGG